MSPSYRVQTRSEKCLCPHRRIWTRLCTKLKGNANIWWKLDPGWPFIDGCRMDHQEGNLFFCVFWCLALRLRRSAWSCTVSGYIGGISFSLLGSAPSFLFLLVHSWILLCHPLALFPSLPASVLLVDLPSYMYGSLLTLASFTSPITLCFPGAFLVILLCSLTAFLPLAMASS